MTATPKTLIAQQNVEDALTTKYTSPANGNGTWVDKFTARNYSAGTETVSVHLVPSGGSADNTNLVVLKSLAAGEDYSFPQVVGKFLDPGDFISWIASTATTISGGANGRERTT